MSRRKRYSITIRIEAQYSFLAGSKGEALEEARSEAECIRLGPDMEDCYSVFVDAVETPNKKVKKKKAKKLSRSAQYAKDNLDTEIY